MCAIRSFKINVNTTLCVCVLSCFSSECLMVTLSTVACQAPLSMGFCRHESWSGLPFPPPGDHLKPGIEPVSPALQEDSLLLSHPGSPKHGSPQTALRSITLVCCVL